jgi:hypothetical protein
VLPENDPHVRDRMERLRQASREPAVQEVIRHELRRGTIRLTPGPDGELTITPTALIWAFPADRPESCPAA